MISTPIFASDGNHLDMFKTLEHAETYLEPWVEEEGVEIFDSKGRKLIAKPSQTMPYDVRLVESTDPASNVPEVLRSKLLNWLKMTGQDCAGFEGWTLQRLVDHFEAHSIAAIE